MATSDEVLIKNIQKGDQQALEALFEKYYYPLCDFAFQYVRNFELTEEIVSDVFLKVWKRRRKLSAEGNFKSYLYRAVRNQSLNYIDKEDEFVDSIDDMTQEITSDRYNPDEDLLYKEFKNHVEALINTLPPRRKIIFKLSRLEGFTYREIADILSISIHTVQNQMVKAIQQLSSHILVNE